LKARWIPLNQKVSDSSFFFSMEVKEPEHSSLCRYRHSAVSFHVLLSLSHFRFSHIYEDFVTCVWWYEFFLLLFFSHRTKSSSTEDVTVLRVSRMPKFFDSVRLLHHFSLFTHYFNSFQFISFPFILHWQFLLIFNRN
jgi:predicted secreted protein